MSSVPVIDFIPPGVHKRRAERFPQALQKRWVSEAIKGHSQMSTLYSRPSISNAKYKAFKDPQRILGRRWIYGNKSGKSIYYPMAHELEENMLPVYGKIHNIEEKSPSGSLPIRCGRCLKQRG